MKKIKSISIFFFFFFSHNSRNSNFTEEWVTEWRSTSPLAIGASGEALRCDDGADTRPLSCLWTAHLSHRPQVDCVIPAAWRQPDLLASIRAGMTQASAWLWNPHADVAKRGTVGVIALGLDSSSPCFSLLTCFIQIPDSTGLHNAIIVVVSFC